MERFRVLSVLERWTLERWTFIRFGTRPLKEAGALFVSNNRSAVKAVGILRAKSPKLNNLISLLLREPGAAESKLISSHIKGECNVTTDLGSRVTREEVQALCCQRRLIPGDRNQQPSNLNRNIP